MDSQRNAEAVPTNVEASVAVMAVEMRYAREALDRIEKAQQTSVPRTEWEQRNAYVDQRFAAQSEKFAEINQKFATAAAEQAARRIPWTAIGAFIVGAGALILSLIDRLTV